MERWVGKIAVVTGASSGIGAAIAVKLANAGMVVIGVARRVDKIQELSSLVTNDKGSIHGVKFDVSDADGIPGLIDQIKANYGGIHVMVNNAGVLRSDKRICDSTTDEYKDLLNINLLSTAVFAREAIKSMRERNFDGHVFNMNSLCGHQVYVNNKMNFSLYSATKFGVTSLSETLRLEMAFMGCMIKVTSISPGIVDTGLFDAGGFKTFEGGKVKSVSHLVPDDIADCLISALILPPTVLVSEMFVRHVKEKA